LAEGIFVVAVFAANAATGPNNGRPSDRLDRSHHLDQLKARRLLILRNLS
jgi:hypothetical protein